jgi:metallo-beta-lactamase family protein
MAQLTFMGAARTVTGSRFLVETAESRVMVDCGLFQGLKELREMNWKPLPVPPASIDAVVITHAHLDHAGYLPRLVSEGFRGRIFCTPGTADLCRVVLPDAARIAEEDARDANRHGYTKHSPALPLFTEADAYRALSQLQPLGYDRGLQVARGISISFMNAGHLLGSAFVVIDMEDYGVRVLFTGDLGRYGRPVLPDPCAVEWADVLVLESTYGNRRHPPNDNGEEVARLVHETLARGGRLIIPAFAVGRVEEVIYWLKKLEEEGRIPAIPVYLDSPMAIEVLRHYSARSDELDPDVRSDRRKLSAFMTRRFQAVASGQQSRDLANTRHPAIVISSSGMATGGRVLHHLKAALPNPQHTVLFVGYQAPGTRGRLLVDGASQVKIHGEMVPVAARIEQIESMSAHADSAEVLHWLGHFTTPPQATYLVHGEPSAMDAMKDHISQRYGWRVETPGYLESTTLSVDGHGHAQLS